MINKNKLNLIASFLFLLCIGLLYFISDIYFLKNYKEIEFEQNDKNLTLFASKIETKLSHMLSIGTDYSVWDDTYEFIKGNKEDYININFRDHKTLLENLELDFMVFVDNKHQMVLSVGDKFDLNKLYDQFDKFEQEQTIKHISKIGSNFFFVTKTPILMSDGNSDIAGYLFLGYEINSTYFNNINTLFQV